MTPTTAQPGEIAQRITELNWTNVIADLDNVGIAAVGPLLGPGECHDLRALYDQSARFRSTIDMSDDFDSWIARCHASGQTRPTPLMLRYRCGDWNALHRDLYGDLVFPLQVVIGLDAPGADYTGGEFVVVEQRPRAQSRATTHSIPQGHGIVFTTRDRPIKSAARGWASAPMRHGVSTLHTGQRHTLGLVFHDAT
jgi:uncharacterized protein